MAQEIRARRGCFEMVRQYFSSSTRSCEWLIRTDASNLKGDTLMREAGWVELNKKKDNGSSEYLLLQEDREWVSSSVMIRVPASAHSGWLTLFLLHSLSLATRQGEREEKKRTIEGLKSSNVQLPAKMSSGFIFAFGAHSHFPWIHCVVDR